MNNDKVDQAKVTSVTGSVTNGITEATAKRLGDGKPTKVVNIQRPMPKGRKK